MCLLAGADPRSSLHVAAAARACGSGCLGRVAVQRHERAVRVRSIRSLDFTCVGPIPSSDPTATGAMNYESSSLFGGVVRFGFGFGFGFAAALGFVFGFAAGFAASRKAILRS